MRTRIVLVVVALAVLALVVFLFTRKTGDFDEAMQKAGQAVVDGDYDKARELYLAALPLAKTPEQRYAVHSVRGALFGLEGRTDEARKAYRAALSVKGVDPDKRFAMYQLLAMTWDYTDNAAQIRATYAQALKEDLSPPVRCAALAGFAGACGEEGDHAAALDAYFEMLQIGDAASAWAVTAHTGIGDVRVAQGKCDEALEAYTEALLLPGRVPFDSAAICWGVGQALTGLGRHAEAQRVLAACADNKNMIPTLRWRAFELIAESLRQEGKTEEAERAREASLYADWDADTDDELILRAQLDCEVASLVAIGRYQAENTRNEAALTAFRAARERQKASPQYRCAASLEVAHLVEGTEARLAALQYVLDVSDAPPEFVSQALLAIGTLHLDNGDKGKARHAFIRLVQMEDAPPEDKQKAQAYLDEMD
jgi:tetratricopeptide (TPR) repeat protein